MLVAVWLVHLSGALGDLLGGLDTALGLGLYVLLWGLVWWATGKAFARVDPASGAPRERGRAGFRYGALTGAGFVLVLAVLAFVAVLAGGGALVPVLIVGTVGSLLALLVGGAIGILFALLDAPLVRAGERLVPGRE